MSLYFFLPLMSVCLSLFLSSSSDKSLFSPKPHFFFIPASFLLSIFLQRFKHRQFRVLYISLFHSISSLSPSFFHSIYFSFSLFASRSISHLITYIYSPTSIHLSPHFSPILPLSLSFYLFLSFTR